MRTAPITVVDLLILKSGYYQTRSKLRIREKSKRSKAESQSTRAEIAIMPFLNAQRERVYALHCINGKYTQIGRIHLENRILAMS